MKPHQEDAALFALKSPLSKGAILADEVGLGKTIEAGLVIAQRWAEQKRRVLPIVPASLRKQWTQELQSKFSVPCEILESKSYRERKKAGVDKPFDVPGKVAVTSYEFAARQADEIALIPWDLVVFDEAHRLRNVFKTNGSQRAKKLRRAVQERFKILLTATPLQNSLLELFGLVSVIDDKFFGDENSFKTRYGRGSDNAALAMLRERLQSISRRTLRKQVLEAGHISYTKRLSNTFQFEPRDKEVSSTRGYRSSFNARTRSPSETNPISSLLWSFARFSDRRQLQSCRRLRRWSGASRSICLLIRRLWHRGAPLAYSFVSSPFREMAYFAF